MTDAGEAFPGHRPGPPVVLIASFRHSGSTLVGDVLAQSPGVRFVGESDRLLGGHDRGCSCGRDLRQCEHWSFDGDLPTRFAERDRVADLDLVRHPASLAVSLLVGRPAWKLRPDPELLAAQRRVWRASSASGHALIDSSKTIALLAAQAVAAHSAITIVHLTRDPRDIISSSLRSGSQRALAGASPLRRLRAAMADTFRLLGGWLLIRRVARATPARLVRLSYESFTSSFPSSAGELSRRVGLDTPDLPTGRHIEVRERHLVWGNQRRVSGEVYVRPPSRDRQNLPLVMRPVLAAVAALTASADRGTEGRRRHSVAR